MTPPVFLEGWARALLVLHAVLAVALAGAVTHQALAAVRWLGGRPFTPQTRRWSQWVGALWVAAFWAGLAVYPAYRYRVRGLYLDRYEPWASNLFDIKENLFGLGLPLAVGLFFVGRSLGPETPRAVQAVLAWASLALWTVFVAASVMGVVVTSVKGV